MKNRREHSRLPLSIDVKISHPLFGEKVVTTKNFSEGGLFILAEPSELPPVGDFVDGQVQGMADEAPIVRMKIVRMEGDGLGLQYVVNEG